MEPYSNEVFFSFSFLAYVLSKHVYDINIYTHIYIYMYTVKKWISITILLSFAFIFLINYLIYMILKKKRSKKWKSTEFRPLVFFLFIRRKIKKMYKINFWFERLFFFFFLWKFVCENVSFENGRETKKERSSYGNEESIDDKIGTFTKSRSCLYDTRFMIIPNTTA